MDTQATTSGHGEPPGRVDLVVLRATRVFRIGFCVSLALLIAGVGLIVLREQSLPSHLVPLDEVMPDTLEGSAAAIITLGILTMVLTPLISTVTIGLTFFQQGDKRYALLTASVLFILILSLSLSVLD